jgi:hypothetical protein
MSDLIINIRFWKYHLQVTYKWKISISKNDAWKPSWPLFVVHEFDPSGSRFK